MKENSGTVSSSRSRTIIYWVTTILIVIELAVSAVWDILRIPYIRTMMEHLGYPHYFAIIIGIWEILGVIALLAPRFPRVKEWAYAGIIFVMTGAIASRIVVGDNVASLVGPIIITGLSVTSWALRPPTRRNLVPVIINFAHAVSVRSRIITYWVTTVVVAAELALGGIWDVFQIRYVRTMMEHLGYPNYFAVIMGIWKIPGAIILLVPRFPRLKEWAYAGAIFTYTGAVASHLAVGDHAGALVVPVIFAGFTSASWALRPLTRSVSH